MITIFSCPRHFEGHTKVIQRNAIKSWISLTPKPELILLGVDRGVKEVCNEFGLKHIPNIDYNEFGTPFYSDVFEKGQKGAECDIVCYVNADIILTNSLMKAVSYVSDKKKNFMLVGRRGDIRVTNPLNFENRESFAGNLLKCSRLCSKFAIDYFVFPKGMFRNLPPFVLGRPSFDNWLLYKTRKMGITLIDATSVVNVFHQKHDYLHVHGIIPRTCPEAEQNLKLAGSAMHLYSIDHASHILTKNGLKSNFFGSSRAYFSILYDVQMGELGIYLKKNFPWIYVSLTRLKKAIKSAVGLKSTN
jgi:hypothetical protein